MVASSGYIPVQASTLIETFSAPVENPRLWCRKTGYARVAHAHHQPHRERSDALDIARLCGVEISEKRASAGGGAGQGVGDSSEAPDEAVVRPPPGHLLINGDPTYCCVGM